MVSLDINKTAIGPQGAVPAGITFLYSGLPSVSSALADILLVMDLLDPDPGSYASLT
ncbi:hypothetical protein [Dyella sp.]|uniref:hypothetical protein n=1 Tax=Dyella sp. TaxID=1869338 RepID=UPI0028524BC7|nr:hypothetical protein [Dyella sp.]